MLAAQIPFPPISPEIFSLDIGGFTFALRWYALAYIAGFLLAWRMILGLLKKPELWPLGVSPMKPVDVENLLTWIIIGVILGGRIGYAAFYMPEYYLANPAQIFMITEGGMSFHGGLLGAALAGFLFARRYEIPPSSISDAMAFAVTPGLFFGRLANFINAELWGQPTTQSWGVIFPGQGGICPPGWLEEVCARHPTQLYEAGLEGLLLGLVLWLLVRGGALRKPWFVTGAFFTGYGLARILVEFWRVPDDQFLARDAAGYVLRLGDWGLTMGQTLSLPMVAFGLTLMALATARGAR